MTISGFNSVVISKRIVCGIFCLVEINAKNRFKMQHVSYIMDFIMVCAPYDVILLEKACKTIPGTLYSLDTTS